MQCSTRTHPHDCICSCILQDRTLRLWNPHKGFDIKVYKGHGYEVRDVSVSTDNSQMASAGGDRQLFLWDVASGSVIRKFRGHDARINAVRACFCNSHIISNHVTGEVAVVCNASTGRCMCSKRWNGSRIASARHTRGGGDCGMPCRNATLVCMLSCCCCFCLCGIPFSTPLLLKLCITLQLWCASAAAKTRAT
jgi:hypothetical protein